MLYKTESPRNLHIGQSKGEEGRGGEGGGEGREEREERGGTLDSQTHHSPHTLTRDLAFPGLPWPAPLSCASESVSVVPELPQPCRFPQFPESLERGVTRWVPT